MSLLVGVRHEFVYTKNTANSSHFGTLGRGGAPVHDLRRRYCLCHAWSAHGTSDSFTEARADSSRVRAALGRIAVERWRSEAPVWGHGVVEGGPHLVEYMPIGSHHTWFGLLFVKGAVGFVALVVPMLVSLLELGVKASRTVQARIGFGMMLLLFLYTFGENLEVLAYLIWPGLLFIGLGARPANSPSNSPSELKPKS